MMIERRNNQAQKNPSKYIASGTFSGALAVCWKYHRMEIPREMNGELNGLECLNCIQKATRVK
jgi:hypothetical protein